MGKERSFKVLTGHCLGAGRGDVFEGEVVTIPQDLTPAEAASKLTLGYIEEIPVVEEELPATEEELPATEEELPATEEELPAT